jgi:hypothetical protein
LKDERRQAATAMSSIDAGQTVSRIVPSSYVPSAERYR